MNTVFELLSNDSISMEIDHFNEVVKKISQSAGSGERDDHTKFFKYNWMPFVMAALIGFRQKNSRPLSGEKKNDVFKYINIQRGSDNLFKLLVLNVIHIHGKNVLENKSEIKKTIEEHANAGFDFLSEKIKDDNEFLYDIDYLKFLREYQKLE
jgi:hypothetical protein